MQNISCRYLGVEQKCHETIITDAIVSQKSGKNNRAAMLPQKTDVGGLFRHHLLAEVRYQVDEAVGMISLLRFKSYMRGWGNLREGM